MLDDKDEFLRDSWVGAAHGFLRNMSDWDKRGWPKWAITRPEYLRKFGRWLIRYQHDIDLELSIELAFKGLARRENQ